MRFDPMRFLFPRDELSGEAPDPVAQTVRPVGPPARGWAVYEDLETGALVDATQRKTSGLFCSDAGDVEMLAGDYVVCPPGGGRRMLRKAVFEARFVPKEAT